MCGPQAGPSPTQFESKTSSRFAELVVCQKGTICEMQVRPVCSELLKCGGAVAADVSGVDSALGLEEKC
jgi:hypothetical protein